MYIYIMYQSLNTQMKTLKFKLMYRLLEVKNLFWSESYVKRVILKNVGIIYLEMISFQDKINFFTEVIMVNKFNLL